MRTFGRLGVACWLALGRLSASHAADELPPIVSPDSAMLSPVPDLTPKKVRWNEARLEQMQVQPQTSASPQVVRGEQPPSTGQSFSAESVMSLAPYPPMRPVLDEFPTTTEPIIPDFPSQGPPLVAGPHHSPVPMSSMPDGSLPTQDLWTEQVHDRVVDLVPDADQRDLIRRVREVVETTEVGVDVSEQEWITVDGDGKRITWGGRAEGDWVSWARDEQFGGQSNYVDFRRLRLFASGEGYGVYDYQLEFEFTPDAEDMPEMPDANQLGVQLKDVFIGLYDIPFLGYTRIGHFRVPIGLENTTSTRFNNFMERSLNSRLLPGRKLGIAAYNRTYNGNVTWASGFFFDDVDDVTQETVDDNQGIRFVGRTTWTPYYDDVTGGRCLFHTGLGYSYTMPRERGALNPFVTDYRPVRFSARPEISIGDNLIDTGNINVDAYHVLNGELAWVNGPLSVKSELTWTSLETTQIDPINLYGAYVQASWFLTGETRPYDRTFARFGRVIPYENFFAVNTPRGKQAGLGAWELAFRWSHLNFDDVGDQRLHDLTLGLNWYWNPHTRLMMNWIHPMAHASPQGTQLDSDGDLIAIRLQLDF